jgi:hypothetical protein
VNWTELAHGKLNFCGDGDEHLDDHEVLITSAVEIFQAFQ